MSDFGLTLADGRPEMSLGLAEPLFNNVYLSLAVQRGSFFANPGFGSRLHLLKKNTAAAPARAVEYAKEALKWIVDVGRAKSIEVEAERDPDTDLFRLKLAIRVTRADGQVLAFTYWQGVV